MNEVPRQFRGTLLERAAARFDLSPRAPLAGPSFAARVEARAPRRQVTIDREALAARGMIEPGGPVTPLAEEFRLVKRHVLTQARAIAAGKGDAARMVLLSSAKPGEGKTFCTVNLALSLAAERDLEILLVDADFAKPDVLATLGVESDGPGLLDAIADPALDVEDCILATDVPQLMLLPAGRKSTSDTELVASARAHAILAQLAAGNPRRVVLFDSSPALEASPAAVLAGHVGQTIVVVRADRTGEADLRATVALLDACDHVELLLNSVAFQPGGRRFGNYYGQEAERP